MAGVFYSDQYIFVHRSYYAYTDCVFAVKSFWEVERYLKSVNSFKLKSIYDSATRGLRITEQLSYNLNHFFNTYSGINGYIEYLRALWNGRVIVAIGIPFGQENNPKIKQWLERFSDHGKMPGEVMTPLDDLSAPAITDEMADEKKEKLSITNPRWEHKDENRKKESPDTTIAGDIVILKADVKGIPEGVTVSFDIYDTAVKPPARIDTVKGKNKEGVGSAEWTVEDPRGAHEEREVKLEFEGVVRSKASVKCEIPLNASQFKIRLHINPASPETSDDMYVLFSTDEQQTYYQTKTVKDDKMPGDDYLDLVFTGIEDRLKYTLVVDPGQEGDPYHVFTDVEGSKLLNNEEVEYTEEKK